MTGLWPETEVRLFRPDHRHLQRLALAGLAGGSCPPHTRLGAQSVHSIQDEGLSLLRAAVFLAQLCAYGGLFTEGLLLRPSLGASA